MLLSLMLPDPHVRTDPDKIVYYGKGCNNITTVVEEIGNLAPYIFASGDVQSPIQTFLVIDKKVVCEVTFEDVPFVLISVFNICYLKGCSNIYSFIEIKTLLYRKLLEGVLYTQNRVC